MTEAYRFDLDNDGRDDIYARQKSGRGNWLSFAIYQWDGERWLAIEPHLYYQQFGDIEEIGYDFSHESDITFVSFEGATYVVAAVGGTGPDGGFALHILHIKDRVVRGIGKVTVSYGRKVTILHRAQQ